MSQVPAEVPGTGGTGSLSAGAWPFCVGSGRTAGQAVILAPPFLITAGRTFLLFSVTAAAGQRAGSVARAAGGRLWRCRVSDDKAGEFTAVFLARRATPAMVGENGEALLDSASRPIYFFAGVVLRGGAADIPAAAFDQAVTVATDEMGAFWKADDKHARVKPAVLLDVPADAPGPAAPMPPEPALAATELPPVTYPPVRSPEPEPEPGPNEQREAGPEKIGARPEPERDAGSMLPPRSEAGCRGHALLIALVIIAAVLLALAVYLVASR